MCKTFAIEMFQCTKFEVFGVTCSSVIGYTSFLRKISFRKTNILFNKHIWSIHNICIKRDVNYTYLSSSRGNLASFSTYFSGHLTVSGLKSPWDIIWNVYICCNLLFSFISILSCNIGYDGLIDSYKFLKSLTHCGHDAFHCWVLSMLNNVTKNKIVWCISINMQRLDKQDVMWNTGAPSSNRIISSKNLNFLNPPPPFHI